MADYYILGSPKQPWGDYGDALFHGYVEYDDASQSFLVSRAGPFVPPVSQPFNAILLTDALRLSLLNSGLSGFTLQPVVKQKIVDIDWQQWDLTAPEPDEYPDSGVPEDYIAEGEHSPLLAEKMGALWVLNVGGAARVERERSIVRSNQELRLVLASTHGLDFVRSLDVGYCFVSERAKIWLSAHTADCLTFEAIAIATATASFVQTAETGRENNE